MSTSHQPAHHTPTLPSGGTNAPSKSSAQTSAAVALGMSWQLLVVIVLPLIAGRYADTQFHASPLWTIVGLVIGLAGTIVVVRQAMTQLNEIMSRDEKGVQK
jgi:F0F1-type ATP synthase assembly protein I